MGISRAELIIGPIVGTMLLTVGWALCASAWRRRGPEVSPESEAASLESAWPPAPIQEESNG